MRKGTDLIGKPVIAYNTGCELARVCDLIFSQDQGALIALMIQEPGLFSSGEIVLIADVQAIGADGILIPSAEAIQSARQVPLVQELIKRDNILRGTAIMTVSGRNLGKMVDLYFDSRTGSVEGYEVSGGLFADAYTGRSFVPVSDTFRIGQDFAFVPDSVVELMEEQVGGLKGAMLATSEKAQDLAQQTSEKAKELAQQTSEKAQELGKVAAEKLDTAQEKALSAVTDQIVSAEAQKQFALGRPVQSEVYRPNGSIFLTTSQVVSETDLEQADHMDILDAVYRATGGDVVKVAQDKLSAKADHLSRAASQQLERTADKTREAVASYTVEESLGRRVRSMVYNRNREVIAATGQIVTMRTIEQARRYQQEKDLMEATGLSVKDAAKLQTSLVADQASAQAQQLGQQVQHHALNAVTWVKQSADELFDKSKNAIEDQRIKGALGRPVNRVILDQADNVVLNVGELVTHRAILEARRSDALDILLDSIYDEEPYISSSEMKAGQNGRAALAKNNSGVRVY